MKAAFIVALLVLGACVPSSEARNKKPGCGGKWQRCCSAGRPPCSGSFTCQGGRCRNPPPRPAPVPAPVPAPIPAPVPAPVPVPTPGPVVTPGPIVIPGGPGPLPGIPTGGVISTATINGAGIGQIGSGTSLSQGAGNTFSTKLNGGAALSTGTQLVQVAGVGPSAGQAAVNGLTDVRGPGISTTSGGGSASFLGGGGPTTGGAQVDFNAVSLPTSTAGNVKTLAQSTSAGGAATATQFGLTSFDP